MTYVSVTEGATGSIKQIATDTVGGVDYGIVKLYDPTVGATLPIGVSSNPISVNLGTTSIGTLTNPIIVGPPASGALPVSGGIHLASTSWTQPVSATSLPTVSIGNYPATQTVNGTISIGAQPSVTGTVSIGNAVNLASNSTSPIGIINQNARSVASLVSLSALATVSVSQGMFSGGSFLNTNTTPVYIQVFDSASNVTLGLTTPTFVQPIPAGPTSSMGAGYVFNTHPGIAMANGIKVAATTAPTNATLVSSALTGYILYRLT